MKNKKILCKIIDVEPNLKDYSEEFFNTFPMPVVGETYVVEREYWYPFSVGEIDGEGVYLFGRPLFYISLEQISII